jgi:peptide/nickel transport system permease protein
MKYMAHRVLQSFFLLVGVSILSFLFVELSPGDYFDEMRLTPQISRETVSRLRTQHGLDQSLPVRYALWLGSVARGEFGFSLAYNTPVSHLLWPRARNTLILTMTATLLAWLVALPLGVLSADESSKWVDHVISLSTGALSAIPDLLFALGLLLLAVGTHLLPVGGMTSLGSDDLDMWERTRNLSLHLIGPAVALAMASLPTLVRHTRSAMLEALNSPYVRAARAHGIPRRRLLLRHALPVALNPLISLFGLSVGSLLSASLLTEVIFSWPGLGPLLLEAILGRDIYVVIGAVIFASVLLVFGSLLCDVLLVVADPRIRSGRAA